jgi:hypothetical protein
MTVKVSQAASTQDISFADSIASLNPDSFYCGTRTYTISPTNNFLMISGTTLSLFTVDVLDVGTYDVTLKI